MELALVAGGLAVVAFLVLFYDGRRKAKAAERYKTELGSANEKLEAIRAELEKSRRSSLTVSDLRELFKEADDS